VRRFTASGRRGSIEEVSGVTPNLSRFEAILLNPFILMCARVMDMQKWQVEYGAFVPGKLSDELLTVFEWLHDPTS